MKINKKTLETLISEGFASSFVRGLTKGGKRKNAFTDFLGSMMVPQSTKLAYEAAKELAVNLENMKNNAKWTSIAKAVDSEGAAALPGVVSAVAGLPKTKDISIHMLHKTALAIIADIERIGQQLGDDAPEMESDDKAADSPKPEEDAVSGEPANDDSGGIPDRKARAASARAARDKRMTASGRDPFAANPFADDNMSENLRKQIRRRLRQL